MKLREVSLIPGTERVIVWSMELDGSFSLVEITTKERDSILSKKTPIIDWPHNGNAIPFKMVTVELLGINGVPIDTIWLADGDILQWKEPGGLRTTIKVPNVMGQINLEENEIVGKIPNITVNTNILKINNGTITEVLGARLQ